MNIAHAQRMLAHLERGEAEPAADIDAARLWRRDMPKPIPPAEYPVPAPHLFALSKVNRNALAAALGVKRLWPHAQAFIEHKGAALKQLEKLPNDTTPGGDIAAIEALLESFRGVDLKAKPFTPGPPGAPIRSGISGETFDNCLPYVTNIHAAFAKARAGLEEEIARLRRHRRVDPKQEKLSFILSGLRLFFDATQRGTPNTKSARGHKFLILFMEACGIDCDKNGYRKNPDRIDELSSANGGMKDDEREALAAQWRAQADYELKL